jgi:hypothetical protein
MSPEAHNTASCGTAIGAEVDVVEGGDTDDDEALVLAAWLGSVVALSPVRRPLRDPVQPAGKATRATTITDIIRRERTGPQ